MNNLIEIVNKHLKLYPLMQEEDLYKLAHQSFFGPAHFISDKDYARTYLFVEAESCKEDKVEINEIGGGYYRYSLINDGEYLESLCDAFIESANTSRVEKDGFEQLLLEIGTILPNIDLKERFLQLIKDLKEVNYPAISHSQTYRENYHPHYRLVHKNYINNIKIYK